MNHCTQNPVSRWQDRIVQIMLIVLVGYFVVRGLAPSSQSAYLDRFSDAALGASILIILKLISDLRESSRALNSTVDLLKEATSSASIKIDDRHFEVISLLERIKTAGITRFKDPTEFFYSLRQDAQTPHITRYYGTAIRVQSTEAYGSEGKRHYDSVFSRCKEDKNFCATRVVGVANKAMFDWACHNVSYAKENPRFSVRVILWKQKFSMINMALLGDTGRIHKVYLALTIARAPDTFGFCIEDHPDIAAYFKQYFDHMYREAVDPLQNPEELSRMEEEVLSP